MLMLLPEGMFKLLPEGNKKFKGCQVAGLQPQLPSGSKAFLLTEAMKSLAVVLHCDAPSASMRACTSGCASMMVWLRGACSCPFQTQTLPSHFTGASLNCTLDADPWNVTV